MRAFWAAALLSLATLGNAAQPAPDPTKLLQEADRLAWLRAWGAAEPLFAQAQKLFSAQGDQRNALYAEVSAFRGQLPRTSVPAASSRLAEYLQHPLVQSDERLRLRVLVIKGETDEDLDPTLAGESWREVQALAEKLGDAAWANRAKGELGLVAFLQGDVGGSVIGLGQAVKVAQSNGDVSSLVRWLTLFGHGYVQLGRPQEALDFYDRALKAAAAVPELQFSVSLVRPFIASGARTVVANLWAADDTFSLALMREFYRRLAAGTDISEALRDAKLHMLKSFGPQAVPKLWSGVLAYGDGRGVIARAPEATASRGGR